MPPYFYNRAPSHLVNIDQAHSSSGAGMIPPVDLPRICPDLSGSDHLRLCGCTYHMALHFRTLLEQYGKGCRPHWFELALPHYDVLSEGRRC